MARLGRGDLPPRLRTPTPGPRSRALSRALARHEAPGINTLPAGGGPTLVWQEAVGANVLDVDGNRFVDLTSGFGVAALGHRPPAVVAAVRRQAGRLVHGLGDVHAHPLRAKLAARLAALVPVDDAQVYFAISGGDAVEIALKTALLATGRRRIVAFEPSYHGLTLGALALTSRPAFRAPFADHLSPEVVHLPYACPAAEVAAVLAGEPAVAAVVVEPVVGREGILVPPPGWLAEVAAACRARGTLLVADEILTAFARTGARFAVDADGVRPDLLCCGKALAGGLPLAVVVGRRELFAAWARGGEALHTATFVAHPLACAAALAALPRLTSARLLARVVRLGAAVGARLVAWPERFAAVTAVRGRGLLWGVELRSAEQAAAAVAAARDRGVLWLAGGPEGRVAQILPPLTIAARQLDGALDLLEEALAAAGSACA
jgi:4-aminobutyrate aminotransferase-like enzyme